MPYFDQLFSTAAIQKSSNAIVATLKDSSVRIEFLKGTIAAPIAVDAVINAANSSMAAGGGGTNAALSNAFDVQSWKDQAEKYKTTHNKTHLDVSEVAVFDFVPRDKSTKAHPRYLFQVLGPVVGNAPLEESKKQVYKAYKNIFSKCAELKLESVLMPLLSAGIFAGAHQDDPVWLTHIREALFQALSEELNKPGTVLKVVKIIDNNQIPFAAMF